MWQPFSGRSQSNSLRSHLGSSAEEAAEARTARLASRTGERAIRIPSISPGLALLSKHHLVLEESSLAMQPLHNRRMLAADYIRSDILSKAIKTDLNCVNIL